MTEKKKFAVSAGLSHIAGQRPDASGHVLLSDREALYERAIGRISPVKEPVARRMKPVSKPDLAPLVEVEPTGQDED